MWSGLKLRQNWILFLGLGIFIGFSLISPFSGKNIVSDLGPEPDVYYYLSPLVNLAENKGLAIFVGDRSFIPNVPPLYTASLLPLFLLTGDVRSFYLTNTFLAFCSLLVFYLVLVRLTQNVFVRILTLGFFVFNPLLTFYTTTAMAENLLIPLFLISIFLFLSQIKYLNVFLASILAVSFFAVKYVAWEVSTIFGVFYFLFIALSRIERKLKFSYLFFFATNLILIAFILGVIFKVTYHLDFIELVGGGIKNTVISIEDGKRGRDGEVSNFSYVYVEDNLHRYLGGLMGGDLTVAGDDFPLIPAVLGMIGIPALFINPLFKKNRFIGVYFISITLAILFYISRFFVVDGRYVFILIPVLFLSFALMLDNLAKVFSLIKRENYYYVVLTAVYLFSIGSLFLSTAYFELLARKYGVPEKYSAVKVIESFIKKESFSAEPVVITSLSPLYNQLIINERIVYLPLSKGQSLADRMELVWGIEQNANLANVYRDYLRQGRRVFVSNFHAGAGYFFSIDLANIQDLFELRLVKEGCGGECDLYEMF